MAFKYRFSLATVLAADFGCCQFRIIPEIVSNRVLTAIGGCCAVLLDISCCTVPFPRTDNWFRSAALHSIQFGTRGFVPVSYFYSENHEWLEDWGSMSQEMSAAFVCNKFLQKKLYFHFPSWYKKDPSSWPQIYKAWDFFLTLELSQHEYCKSGSTFS